MEQAQPTEYVFTCVTCALAFNTSHIQRQHFTSDLHRYNAKRRVVQLPPVSAEIFNDKVLQRRNDESHPATVSSSDSRLACKVCSKSFNTENALASHLKSRKHRDVASRPVKEKAPRLSGKIHDESAQLPAIPTDATDEEIREITKRVKDLMPPVPSLECLFCHPSNCFSSEDALVKHMHQLHGFFIPDQNYLVDRPGLLAELAVTVGTWNACIFCGTAFGGRSDEPTRRRGLEAVRKHMSDKNHCKLPWRVESERLRYSDHYDYSSSYPAPASDDGNDEWEDEDDNGSAADEDPFIDNQDNVRLGETPFELVLPSGAKIGHRALRRVYKQNLAPYSRDNILESQRPSLKSLPAPERRRMRAEQMDLIPVRNANGRGQELIHARNRGEAKEAGRSIKEFWESRRKEQQRSRVAMKVGNHQKHYRDQLLQ